MIRILFPFSVTDRNPEIYRFARAISPFRRDRSDVFRLAIHVRRGDLYVLNSDRMLPNSYYVACALAFQEVAYKLDIPLVCELYTEAPSKTFEVTPHHHGIRGRISTNVALDPSMDRLEDFDVIHNLEKFINLHPIETLRRMATADALILSRSAFSLVAAVLSENCTVVCWPSWPCPMKDWLIWGGDRRSLAIELIERVLSWKKAAD